MSDLAGIVLVFGGVLSMLYLLPAFLPRQAYGFIKGFPRNRYAGIVLTVIDLLWAGYLLHAMPMGRFDLYKPLLLLLVPAAILLICNFMPELLAVRALGGLALLVPAPLLDAARWHPSPARLVVVVVAYLIVVKGMVLLLSPYRFRQAVEFFMPDSKACRVWGLTGLVFSICLLALAVTVY